MPRDYRKLKVFQVADDLVTAVYQVTRSYPKEELFGLTSQMRRAAVSVPANIAEGAAREGEREFVHFLSTAYGSLTGVRVAHRVGLIKKWEAKRSKGDAT